MTNIPRRVRGSLLAVGLLVLALTTEDVQSERRFNVRNYRIRGRYRYRHSVVKPAATASPIGWKVPAKRPPPAYSASNPVSGAHNNIYARPPSYNLAYNSAHPKYLAATQTHRNTNPHSPALPAAGTAYRFRNNQVAGRYGSSGGNTPITATNFRNVPSTYPTPQLPPGATYHPAGQFPAGTTHYPASPYPMGTPYHPAVQIPHGATYDGEGLPPRAIFLQAGGALPAEATYYPQATEKSSSGLFLDTGRIAGAVGGAILDHVLKPTLTRVLDPSYSGGGGGGGSSGGDDKIIIINNGTPGSRATSSVLSGPKGITTGRSQATVSPSLPVPPAPAYAAPASSLAAQPMPPAPGAVPLAPADPKAPAAPPLPAAPGAVANPSVPVPAAPSGSVNPNAPPAGGISSMPVKVPTPGPTEPTKTIEVEKIACYPAPPPEAAPSANGTAPAAVEGTVPPPVSAPGSVNLAPFQHTTPVTVPEGSVPLAPIVPGGQPDIMKMPGPTSARLSAESGLKDAHNVAESSFGRYSLISTLLTLLVAFCLH